MNLRIIILVVALVANEVCYAQGFINLDFESANTSGYSSGYSSPILIPTNNAVPGWTVYFGSAQQPTIPYNTIALDSASVDLEGTNSQYGPYPIQGNYSIYVQGGTQFDPDHNGASMMQTGQIPADALSIIFWGGSGNFSTQPSVLNVTFNGQNLSLTDMGDTANYTIWAADISAFAGQTGTLSFHAPWQTSSLLDNIQFSSSPIPEPSALGLSALGGLLLACRRWKFFRYEKR